MTTILAWGASQIGGQRLAYTEYGYGPRLTILLHGLLLNQRMHDALARALAERGQPRDHARPARPRRLGPADGHVALLDAAPSGAQVIALLDHLGVDEAVVLGTSLGANARSRPPSRAPERVRGMVVEMPVLDNALIGCALAFTPMMVALTFGEPVDARRLARGARGSRAAAAVAGGHRARLGAPGPGAERRGAPGPVLRPHRAAPRGARGRSRRRRS